MDSKCTHKKDSLHVFWMLRVIYKKNRTEPAVFFKTEPKPKPNRTRGFYQNRTETEPNLKNPFRTSLTYIHTYIHTYTSGKNCGHTCSLVNFHRYRICHLLIYCSICYFSAKRTILNDSFVNINQ